MLEQLFEFKEIDLEINYALVYGPTLKVQIGPFEKGTKLTSATLDYENSTIDIFTEEEPEVARTFPVVFNVKDLANAEEILEEEDETED